MTEILTQSGGGEYNIHFRTDNPEAYKTVQEICRLYIDKERLTPKKPRKDEYGFYMCPSCGADEYALMHDSNIANCYKNCHNCGQALDWSDTE